jgi:hypothetical protein
VSIALVRPTLAGASMLAETDPPTLDSRHPTH